jgi:N-methylhydantoinase A/oxoprolinase/acetone carboxylase beta subunit
MRYVGQGFNVRVSIPGESFDETAPQQLQTSFEGAYQEIYGRLAVGVPVQIVNWRVNVSGPRPDWQQLRVQQPTTGQINNHHKGNRKAVFGSEVEPADTPVYDRYTLPDDFTAQGPAIVEEAEATTIVLPGWSVRLDLARNLILSRAQPGQ